MIMMLLWWWWWCVDHDDVIMMSSYSDVNFFGICKNLYENKKCKCFNGSEIKIKWDCDVLIHWFNYLVVLFIYLIIFLVWILVNILTIIKICCHFNGSAKKSWMNLCCAVLTVPEPHLSYTLSVWEQHPRS